MKSFDINGDEQPNFIDRTVKEKVAGWKRLSKQVVYDNSWIQVTHEDVQRPNGSEGIYGVVHFKNRALGIVPIDTNGNTWLVKQSRYSCDEITYEIPEGGGMLGENPLESAQRELAEETGLRAENWQKILTLRTSNSVTDELAFIYLATKLTQGKQSLEDTEDIELIQMPLKDAVTMAKNGEITDAMSVAALFKIALDFPEYLTKP